MKRIYIASPLRGDVEGNMKKAFGYCRQVIDAGHVPVCPQTWLPRLCDDEIPEQREKAMQICFSYLDDCDELWAFGDKITDGMANEINYAVKKKIPAYYGPFSFKKGGKGG